MEEFNIPYEWLEELVLDHKNTGCTNWSFPYLCGDRMKVELFKTSWGLLRARFTRTHADLSKYLRNQPNGQV